MRKAGLKSRSRRKAASSSTSSNASSNNTSNSNSDGQPNGGNNGTNEKRKPTSEEAALTAKNYRLAKELSELRIRHRDETKTVTRLTMENMNLATRCREAINHVAMLKKELGIYQRRASEAMAMQRQHQIRMYAAESASSQASYASSTPVFSSVSATEISSEMNQVMAPLPPPLSSSLPNRPMNQNQHYDPPIPQDKLSRGPNPDQPMFAAFQDRGIETHAATDTLSFARISAKQQQMQRQHALEHPTLQYHVMPRSNSPSMLSTKPHANQSFSKRPANRYEIDSAPADELSLIQQQSSVNTTPPSNFFQPTSTTLPSTPERDVMEDSTQSSGLDVGNDNDEFHSINFSSSETKSSELQRGHSVSVVKENLNSNTRPPSPVFSTSPMFRKNLKSMTTNSSIEAFEASFDTAFPNTFSAPREETPPLSMAFDVPEFTDPFFIGSLDMGEGSKVDGTFKESSNEERGSGRPVAAQTSKKSSNGKTEFHSAFHSDENGESMPSFKSSISPENPSEVITPSSSAKLGAVDASDVKQTTPIESETANTFEDFGNPSSSLSLFPPSAMNSFETISERNLSRMTSSNKSSNDKQFHDPSLFSPDIDGNDTFGDSLRNERKIAKTTTKSSPHRLLKKTVTQSRTQFGSSTSEATSSSAQQQHQQQQLKSRSDKVGSGGGNDKSRVPLHSQPDIELNQSPTIAIRKLHQRRAQEKVIKGGGIVSSSNRDLKSGAVSNDDISFEDFTDPGDVPMETKRSNQVNHHSSSALNLEDNSGSSKSIPVRSKSVNNGLVEKQATRDSRSFDSGINQKIVTDEREHRRSSSLPEKENQNSIRSDNGNTESESIADSKVLTNHSAETKLNSIRSRTAQDTNIANNEIQKLSVSTDKVDSRSTGLTEKQSRRLDNADNTTPTNDSTKISTSSSTPSSLTSPASSITMSTRRRNVKQPVSYAEPSLNAKLRRGDVFFPKKEISVISSDEIEYNTSAQTSELNMTDSLDMEMDEDTI